MFIDPNDNYDHSPFRCFAPNDSCDVPLFETWSRNLDKSLDDAVSGTSTRMEEMRVLMLVMSGRMIVGPVLVLATHDVDEPFRKRVGAKRVHFACNIAPSTSCRVSPFVRLIAMLP
jgi:hypothetical protein